MLGGAPGIAQVLVRAAQQIVGFGEVGVDRERALGVIARGLEAGELELRHGPQVEEQRRVRRTLGALQRLERPLGLAFVKGDRGVHDAQVGMAGPGPEQLAELEARLLHRAFVELVPDMADPVPLDLAQRFVGCAHGNPVGSPAGLGHDAPQTSAVGVRAPARPGREKGRARAAGDANLARSPPLPRRSRA